MARRKHTRRKATSSNGANLGFEDKLWAAADKLRGNMEAAEYKHVVLGLIFLKYISDAFQEKYPWLLRETANPKSEYYEYEQNGSDRARYGEYLIDKLADRLRQSGLKRVDARELRRYRQFYLTYPQIREALTPESRAMLPAIEKPVPIRELATPELVINGETILERLSFWMSINI
jgi:type I restriction enzyme M protein